MKNVTYEFTATVIEKTHDGQTFASTLHAPTPERLLSEVKHYLETEVNERDLNLVYDEKTLLDELHGNEDSGPMRIPDRDGWTEFLVSAKRLAIRIPEKGSFSFIHHGARVLWNDPGADDYGPDKQDHLDTVYVVHSVNGSTTGRAKEPDDVILIYDPAPGCKSEAEVPASELVQYDPDPERRIRRYTREADVFLLSCLKYADTRMRSAEATAKEAKQKLENVLAIKKKDRKAFLGEQLYKEQKEQIAKLSQEVHQLRSDRDFFRACYYAVRPPKAGRIGETPSVPEHEKTARFLLGCPDRTQSVLVELAEAGLTYKIRSSRYDETTASAVLTADRFSGEDLESGRYELVCWPDSQEYVGDERCHLVDPESDRNGCGGNEPTSLDSAYMVPSMEGNYVRFGFPDSQEYEDGKDVLSDYEGSLFVPVSVLLKNKKQ